MPVFNPERKEETYGVFISYSEDGNVNTLNYKISLQQLKINLIEINRKNLFIDNKESDMMADELAVIVS